MTVALSNMSCCSHRKAVNESRTEAAEHVATTARTESREEKQHAATLNTETESRGETVTEVEIYDTTQPADRRPGSLRSRRESGRRMARKAGTVRSWRKRPAARPKPRRKRRRPMRGARLTR